MTKILIITNEHDITTDFIVKKLKESGLNFYRLNTNRIGPQLQLCFDLKKQTYTIIDEILQKEIDLTEIKSVYYRRPELPVKFEGLSDGESNFIRNELYFTLEGLYKILGEAFWINKIEAIRRAENKIYQLMLAQKIGFIIPNSLITNHRSTALQFYDENNDCIIKPVKSGLIIANNIEEGIIFTSKVSLNDNNIDRIATCPVYLQKLIKKKGDVRVTIVGTKFFCALIHSQDSEVSKIDWRKSSNPLKHSNLTLPIEVKEKCLELMKILDLYFAAIDFVLDENDSFIFLEINPNGQWAWIEKQLNHKISDEITFTLAKKAGHES